MIMRSRFLKKKILLSASCLARQVAYLYSGVIVNSCTGLFGFRLTSQPTSLSVTVTTRRHSDGLPCLVLCIGLLIFPRTYPTFRDLCQRIQHPVAILQQSRIEQVGYRAFNLPRHPVITLLIFTQAWDSVVAYACVHHDSQCLERLLYC